MGFNKKVIEESIFNLAELDNIELPEIVSIEIQEITLDIQEIPILIRDETKEEIIKEDKILKDEILKDEILKDEILKDEILKDEIKEDKIKEEITKDLNLIIPKRIFQTHKSIKYIQTNPKLKDAMNSWRKFVPEYGYYFYTDEMCDIFMKNEMSQEFDQIYTAYKKLPVAVMKADLWRYCIIYKYGGIYADVDAICKCDPNTFTCNPSMLVLAPENSTHLCQWCFAACARSHILKQIIELSIQRILTVTSFKKPHIIHYLTGPGVFTDGIEKYLISQNMRIFEDKKKYYVYKNSGMICFKYEVFHTILIHHLFTGQDKDGWCNQIQQLM